MTTNSVICKRNYLNGMLADCRICRCGSLDDAVFYLKFQSITICLGEIGNAAGVELRVSRRLGKLRRSNRNIRLARVNGCLAFFQLEICLLSGVLNSLLAACVNASVVGSVLVVFACSRDTVTVYSHAFPVPSCASSLPTLT